MHEEPADTQRRGLTPQEGGLRVLASQDLVSLPAFLSTKTVTDSHPLTLARALG